MKFRCDPPRRALAFMEKGSRGPQRALWLVALLRSGAVQAAHGRPAASFVLGPGGALSCSASSASDVCERQGAPPTCAPRGLTVEGPGGSRRTAVASPPASQPHRCLQRGWRLGSAPPRGADVLRDVSNGTGDYFKPLLK